MKKCIVSRYFTGIYMCGICFIIALLWISLRFHSKGVNVTGNLIISAIGILTGIYLLVVSFPTGTFAVDECGVYMRIGFRRRELLWHEIVECGLISVSAGGNNQIYMVYFSSRYLTSDEKIEFLKKTQKDLDHIAFFEPTSKMLNSMMPFIPRSYAVYLKERARQIGMVVE